MLGAKLHDAGLMAVLQKLFLSDQTLSKFHSVVDLVKDHVDLFSVVVGPEETA